MDDTAREALKKQFLESMVGIRRTLATFQQWHDLHIGEMMALKHLAESDMQGGCGYMADLQPSLNISKPAISQMIGALERKGYIERAHDPTDRRKITVRLTAKGEEAHRSMTIAVGRFADKLIERFGEHESQQLVDLMGRMAATIDEVKAQFKMEFEQ